MRLFVRFRAGKLVAGFGVILAGALSGCWDAPKRPTNLPKGTLNSNNSTGQPGASTAGRLANPNVGSGMPVNRTTGNPPFVDQSSRGNAVGPLGSSGTGNTNANLLSPPGSTGGAGPIATNGSIGKGIQPAVFGPSSAGSGTLGEPDSLPLRDSSNASSATVPPITLQNQDMKVRFRPTPPPFPEESLNPPPSTNGKPGVLPPPQ